MSDCQLRTPHVNEILAAVPEGPARSPVRTDDCPVPVVVTTHAGRPPLLPSSFDQAKLWARGRACTKLGKHWTHKRFRDGFLVMFGKKIANAFLEPVEGYHGPYTGSK